MTKSNTKYIKFKSFNHFQLFIHRNSFPATVFVEIKILQIYTTAAGVFIILRNVNFSIAKSAPVSTLFLLSYEDGWRKALLHSFRSTLRATEHGATAPGQAGTLKGEKKPEGSY